MEDIRHNEQNLSQFPHIPFSFFHFLSIKIFTFRFSQKFQFHSIQTTQISEKSMTTLK